VRLGIVYDSAKQMIDAQVGREDICLSCISNISLENNLTVDISAYDEETSLFRVIDQQSQIDEAPFEFIFLNKFPVQEE